MSCVYKLHDQVLAKVKIIGFDSRTDREMDTIFTLAILNLDFIYSVFKLVKGIQSEGIYYMYIHRTCTLLLNWTMTISKRCYHTHFPLGRVNESSACGPRHVIRCHKQRASRPVDQETSLLMLFTLYCPCPDERY